MIDLLQPYLVSIAFAWETSVGRGCGTRCGDEEAQEREERRDGKRQGEVVNSRMTAEG